MSFLGVSSEQGDGSGVAVNKCLTGAAPETTSPPGPVEEPSGFGGVTLVLVIAVLVILVGGGLWYYREQR